MMVIAAAGWRATAIILFVALLVRGAYAAETLDPRDLCPKSGSKEQTILLIDTTDPLTPVAQERLKQLLKGFGDRDNEHYLQPAHELIVYHLSPTMADMPKPTLRTCNPGNPADRTLVDDLTSGPLEARKRWRVFELRRLRALPRLDEQVEGAQSPLLENIAIITARHVPNLGVGKQRKPTRLFLFSDMLQNSDRLSHYRSLPDMKKFRSMVGYSEMDSDLTGVQVWLFYVRRTGYEKVQTREHYYWWTRAIESFGGRLMEQIPL